MLSCSWDTALKSFPHLCPDFTKTHLCDSDQSNPGPLPVTHYSLVSGLLLHSFAAVWESNTVWSTQGMQGSAPRMRVTLTRQLSRPGSDFKASDTEGKEQGRGRAGHAADSVSRSVALAAANPPGSVPKPPPHPRGAGVTSARKSVIGWGGGERGRGGRGFPQIQLRREEKGGRKRKMHDGKNRCKATFLHPALWLKPRPVFTPLGIPP